MLIASIIFSLPSHSPGSLIVPRILQGAASGLNFTSGLALLFDTTGYEEFGSRTRVVLAGNSVGILMGPFLGGLIYDQAGWNTVYWTMLAVMVPELFLRLLMIEQRTNDQSPARGLGLLTGQYGTLDGTERIASGPRETADTNSIASSATIVPKPRATSINQAPVQSSCHPQNHSILRSLRDPPVLTATVGSFIYVALSSGCESILPLFVQRSLHWKAWDAGFVLLLLALPHLTKPAFVALSNRIGRGKVVIFGILLGSIWSALLTLVEQDTPAEIALLCGLVVLTGEIVINLPTLQSSGYGKCFTDT